MNYNLLEKVNLFIWDRLENFHQPVTANKIGAGLFKAVSCIDSDEKFNSEFSGLGNDELIVFLVHLDHNNDKRGFYTFKNSLTLRNFPNLRFTYISSAPKNRIFEGESTFNEDVISYDDFQRKIGMSLIPQKKSEIIGLKEEVNQSSVNAVQGKTYDIAILTALYFDEFQQIETIIEWNKEQEQVVFNKVFKIGVFKDNPELTVVATFQIATGMVDAAITASQMIFHFNPRYIIMPGVCGGKSSIKIGDIVVASKVYMFQKGKLKDLTTSSGKKVVDVYELEKGRINLDQLVDEEGSSIEVQLGNFELEHDSMIETYHVLMQKVTMSLERIKGKINDEVRPFGKVINTHIDTVACSTMVIDKEQFFDKVLKKIDRKTVAVEMESYGVARSCQLSGGLTKFLIVKSVMDNTVNKNDENKAFAAKVCSLFIKFLVSEKIL